MRDGVCLEIGWLGWYLCVLLVLAHEMLTTRQGMLAGLKKKKKHRAQQAHRPVRPA